MLESFLFWILWLFLYIDSIWVSVPSVQLHAFAYGYTLFPKLFVEKAVLTMIGMFWRHCWHLNIHKHISRIYFCAPTYSIDKLLTYCVSIFSLLFLFDGPPLVVIRGCSCLSTPGCSQHCSGDHDILKVELGPPACIACSSACWGFFLLHHCGLWLCQFCTSTP